MRSDLLLTVAYSAEPEDVVEFSREGQGISFGRDDSTCELAIWTAVLGTELSRIAGRIWRMDGELWLRNLSTSHELQLSRPGWPDEPPLPPRFDDGIDPGPARSIPGELAAIRAPGGCEIVVRQRRLPASLPADGPGEPTTRVPEVPPALLPVATALCEPLLAGCRLPATYSQVMRRAGTATLKRTRMLVTALCEMYVTEVPLLRERMDQRRRAEERALSEAAAPTLTRGVWTFPSATGGSPPDGPDPAENRRSDTVRALALPDYYEVAHLLVRRRLIRSEHLTLLDHPTPTGSVTVSTAG